MLMLGLSALARETVDLSQEATAMLRLGLAVLHVTILDRSKR